MRLASVKTSDKGQETLTQGFGIRGPSVLSLAQRCRGLWGVLDGEGFKPGIDRESTFCDAFQRWGCVKQSEQENRQVDMVA